MSIRIEIPSYLKPLPIGTEVVEVNGSTVGECLNRLVKQFPEVEKTLFAKRDKLHSYVNIYVNGEDSYPEELAKPVKDGDELQILHIIGGG